MGFALASPTAAATSPIRHCGDVTANYPRAGVFNVTARVTSCEVARGVAVRWYFRDQHSPFGYRCMARRTRAGHDVRCTARQGRVVRFKYYVAS
jgi:hypothetical protein